ncbi:MAG: hypothetical protein IPJ98_09025 [Bryobacterales bacterium]|nr:hypothetical protein [Bryobacterales bacterium]
MRGMAGGKWNAELSLLVHEGQPSVFIVLAGPRRNRIDIEVGRVCSEEILHEFVRHPALMREIQEIWRECEAAFVQFAGLATRRRTLPLM